MFFQPANGVLNCQFFRREGSQRRLAPAGCYFQSLRSYSTAASGGMKTRMRPSGTASLPSTAKNVCFSDRALTPTPRHPGTPPAYSGSRFFSTFSSGPTLRRL